MEINIKFEKPQRRTLLRIFVVLAVVAAAAVTMLLWPHSSPIPKAVAEQAPFKAVYPTDIKIVSNAADGFRYSEADKTISFTATYETVKLNVTEQSAPDNLTNGSGVYFQSLGLHPVAQFNSAVGPVALINFYQSGTLKYAGQSAILAAGKTMVIATTEDPQAKLSNEQWKSFFDNLKQSK